MDKQLLLSELNQKMHNGEITKEDIIQILDTQTEENSNNRTSFLISHFSVTKVFYLIGIGIVLLGIIFFVAQIWEDIGSFSRTLVTLGTGLIFTILGSVLLKQKPNDIIGPIFHLLGGIFIPVGAFVMLAELNMDLSSFWTVSNIFAILLFFYILLSIAQRHVILTFFAIVNGTIFLYFFSEALLSPQNNDYYAYLTMAIGINYLLLAEHFKNTWNRSLKNLLYFFGVTGFLVALYTQIIDSLNLEILYFGVIWLFIFLSIKLKSTLILGITTIFLIIHISYITSRYFTDSIGWPLSLVILGFVFIGLGYYFFNINKKYISS